MGYCRDGLGVGKEHAVIWIGTWSHEDSLFQTGFVKATSITGFLRRDVWTKEPPTLLRMTGLSWLCPCGSPKRSWLYSQAALYWEWKKVLQEVLASRRDRRWRRGNSVFLKGTWATSRVWLVVFHRLQSLLCRGALMQIKDRYYSVLMWRLLKE